MIFNPNNLTQYNIFLTVVQEGNLSNAAKTLYISQPAISKAIKKLEESLGCTLFRRTSKGVSLTEDGELLYKHIKQAFSEISAGEDLLRTRKKLGVGRIRFGASTTLCKHFLLPKLKSFVKDNPHISISIDCQSSLHTQRLIEADSIDIGLIAMPESLNGLMPYTAGFIQDTFVASPEYIHNLELREGADNIFSKANLMVLNKENVTHTYINRYLPDYISDDTKLLEIGNMDLLIEFAKTGLGIGCVIREFVENELENGSLIEVNPSGLNIKKREICYAVNEGSRLSPAARLFLENYI